MLWTRRGTVVGGWRVEGRTREEQERKKRGRREEQKNKHPSTTTSTQQPARTASATSAASATRSQQRRSPPSLAHLLDGTKLRGHRWHKSGGGGWDERGWKWTAQSENNRNPQTNSNGVLPCLLRRRRRWLLWKNQKGLRLEGEETERRNGEKNKKYTPTTTLPKSVQ